MLPLMALLKLFRASIFISFGGALSGRNCLVGASLIILLIGSFIGCCFPRGTLGEGGPLIS